MNLAASKELSSGERLRHYEIVKKIGEGGMGAVYLANDLNLRRLVAIKVLARSVAGDGTDLQRFEQEAIAASALNHPNILTIHEIASSNGCRFIVSEYVAGESLREKIGKLSVDESIDIAVQATSALGAAHKNGIVHRDIKPENIMVRDDGIVKILDFGLAKIAAQAQPLKSEAETRKQITEAGSILGTMSYISPEQARGKAVDGRTDIWSLGVVLYEMVSGRRPFGGESLAEKIAAILMTEPAPINGLSTELAEPIRKCLEKDVTKRYQSMSELAEDLKQARSEDLHRTNSATLEKATVQLPAPQTETSHAFGQTNSFRRAIIFAGTALLAVAAIYAISLWPRSPQDPASSAGRSPAYDLYVRGKVKAGSQNREEIEAAIKLLEEAVTIDPNYAEAYATLAQAYSTKAFRFAPDSEMKQVNENAEIAVEKALALNPNLAEGHFARGIVLWTHAKRFPHEQAIQSYKRAIALDPNLSDAHHRLGWVYSHIGLLDEAEQEIRKAIELNPNNTLARFRMAAVVAYQGKYEEAVAIVKTIPQDISPSVVERNLADALVHLGRLDEASAVVEEYLKKYPQDEGGNVTSVKAILLAKAGKEQEAEETIARAAQIGKGYGHFHHTAYNIASAYAIMNKPDDAVKWLEAGADDGFPCYPYFEIDPNLNSLRSDPKFVELMTKLKAQMERFKALAAA